MGHTVEAVNRRVPQLRWAGAERAQVLRAGDQLVRNTQDSGVVPGFARERPRFADVLAYIEEGEPLKEVIPLPKREASIYVNSHYYLDASSSVSGRLAEAGLRGVEGIIAAGAAGIGRATEGFGFRNAERAAAAIEQRVAPTIIGRPSEAEELITTAAEQAAAETAEITATGMATGVGETLAGAAATIAAPEIAIPAAIGLVAGAGGAMLSRSTQKDPPRGSGIAAAASGLMQGARDGAAAYPATRFLGRGVGAAGSAVVSGLMGLGAGFSDGAVSGFGYEWYDNRAVQGFTADLGGNATEIPAGEYKDVLMPPNLIGLFQCGKMLPPLRSG
ncbi:unnamed protein product [Symbiodinium sp. KB8]|nr:unnamed protein product [Symbiodinium sp. KB8]